MAKIQSTSIPFAGCFTKTSEILSSIKIVFAGLPSDSQSSFQRGCKRAPERVRFAYDGNCFSATTESGVDMYRMVTDLGDFIAKNTWDETSDAYRKQAENIFLSGKKPFFVGGDHAVTMPIVEALAGMKQPIHYIHFDAHPDLYPDFNDNIHSHACVCARILEMSHIASVTQIGIRTMNAMQQQLADRYNSQLRIFFARNLLQNLPSLAFLQDGVPVYISIDMDCFDPAYAPGVAHPVPGGLTPRQVLNFIQEMRWKLIGMDVVEVNPEVDQNNQTAILAARILHEAMGYVAKRSL
ncbi:MAG: agmatinase [bacterium]